ncbi:MAG: hypothetical protein P1U53_12990 [Sulfitobacter sp.]|nr:hypothetical protein [Sulfitobacter sp.]
MDPFLGVSLILAAVVALLLIILVNITQYYSKYVTRVYPRALVSRTRLKAGDVLMYIPFCHTFINSIIAKHHFCHYSVVVEDPSGRLHTAESIGGLLCRDPTDGMDIEAPDITAVLPLLARLKTYPGTPFVHSLQRPLGAAQKAALWAAAQTPIPYMSAKSLAVAGFLRATWTRGEMHCWQHTLWLLQQAGVSPAGREWDLGAISVLRELKKLDHTPLSGGNSFAPPVQLIYDLDLGIAEA